MDNIRLKKPVEILYLRLLERWQDTAPEDGKQGLLGGEPERNSQMLRMVYLLEKVASGDDENIFQTLSRYTCRDDGESYISRNFAWMKQPKEIYNGWYFEGCTSLQQKQFILQNLTKVGLSPEFVACADDFVAGKTINTYYPTREEMIEINEEVRIKEAQDELSDDADIEKA